MTVKRVLVLVYLILQCASASSQLPADHYTWWNPAKSDLPVIAGQAWPHEVKNTYDRLPARAEGLVPPRVWALSHDAAGLSVSFRTNSPEIVVRYKIQNTHAFSHMPATGVSGVDLYAVNSDGSWLWAAGDYTFGDTITYRFKDLRPNDNYHQNGRVYKLYMPLYCVVQWLEIGVQDSASFSPLTLSKEKPIVVYGTSIVQGAAASRPGMAWTSILERNMERPLINLGFSGNALLDTGVISLMSEIEAKIYILDCLPNLVYSKYSPAQISDRILNAATELRRKRKFTPILLIQHGGYSDAEIDTSRKKLYTLGNAIQAEAYKKLKARGFSDLYLLTKENIGLTMDCTVDGTHPSDLGMMHYAEATEKILRSILKEPLGVFSTSKPRTQDRDADIYDWQQRHHEVLNTCKTDKPNIVFIGNSIIHYWGGTPTAPISRGNDSWNRYFEPLGMRNFGFGWDRIENAIWRVYHDELDDYNAKQVVVLIGTNNLSVNSDTEIIGGLKSLINAIKVRQTKSDILLLGLLPRRGKEERVLLLNIAIKSLAASLHIEYADLGKPLLEKDKIDEKLFVDGLHPNALGYQKIAKLLYPHLKNSPKNASLPTH